MGMKRGERKNEEGVAERERRRGLTFLSLADEDRQTDRQTDKISIRVTRENLFLIGFDYRVSIRGVGSTWSCRREAAGLVLGVGVKRERGYVT